MLLVTALSLHFHPQPEGEKRRGRERSPTSENQDSINQAIPHQTFVIFTKNALCEDKKLYIVVLSWKHFNKTNWKKETWKFSR